MRAKIVVDHRRLARIVDRLRGAGKRVALTNGGFDLFHVGHLRSLAGARRRCDCLVVAVNTDASVRRHKGAGRPVVPLAERMEILAALSCVDYVTPFSSDTVTDLIRLLRPRYHAKGTDYTPATDPEREAIRAVGGRTIIVGDPKRHSSSGLIRSLSRRA